jgi:hypothetical protein
MSGLLKIAPAATTLVVAVAGSLYANCVYSSRKQLDQRFIRLFITSIASAAIGHFTRYCIEKQGVKVSDGNGQVGTIGFMALLGTWVPTALLEAGNEFAEYQRSR